MQVVELSADYMRRGIAESVLSNGSGLLAPRPTGKKSFWDIVQLSLLSFPPLRALERSLESPLGEGESRCQAVLCSPSLATSSVRQEGRS